MAEDNKSDWLRQIHHLENGR